MKKNPAPAGAINSRRARAGAEPRARKPGSGNEPAQAQVPAAARRQLEELRAQQAELETQNADLLRTRTEREAALQNYRDLYDFAPIGCLSLDSRGIIRRLNLSAAEKLGTERGLLVGKSFVKFVPTELRDAFQALLAEAFAVNQRRDGEFVLLRRGHPRVTVKIRALSAPGSLECNLIVIDISGRKHAEEKLRVSEIRYRRLFEAARDGVILVDPETRKITDANPYIGQLLEFPTDHLIGKELFEIGLVKDEKASRDMLLELKQAHEIRYENLPLQCRSGKLQEVEVVANLYQENGSAVIQFNIRDITQRKLAESALRRSESLFAALVEQAPVGVVVLDLQFCLQQVNPVARLTFTERSSPIGRNFFEITRNFWPKRIHDQIIATFRHTMATGEGYQALGFSERRRDTRAMESYDWQVQRVTLPAGIQGLVCFFTDITKRKKADEAQRRLEVVTAINKKLQLEIVRRRELEKSLRTSKREQTRLLHQSRGQQEKLRGISHQILKAQEEERKRISRELHDVIAQSLLAINMHVAALGKEGLFQLDEFQEKVARTQLLVGQSVSIVHEFARELRPTVLDDLGLIPALEASMKSFMEDTGIRVDFKVFAGIERCPDAVRTVLYRVTNAALANVAQHSAANLVEVIIHNLSGVIHLEITDDGKGFDARAALTSRSRKNPRLGLLGMKERVEMVGGVFEIVSIPSKLTTVRAEFPLTGQQKSRLVKNSNAATTVSLS